ncbi:SAYSvFN domain-containing protein 1 isoform X1 [Centroberyx gerrardi]
MEQKLAEFRARRKAENATRKDECTVPQSKTLTVADTAVQPDSTSESATTAGSKQSEELSNTTTPPSSRDTSPVSSPQARDAWLLDSALGRWLGSTQLAFSNLTLLKMLLWLVLLGLFAELDFGLPFFLISLFYWLYEGLRSPATREPGELSAYSVFNPDCQPLLGALTAEQLEGEMGYRPLANR